MQGRNLSYLMLGAMGAVVIIVVIAITQIAGLDRSIADMARYSRPYPEEIDMDPLVTTVTHEPTGLQITVTTNKLDGETDADQLKRHLARCELAKGG